MLWDFVLFFCQYFIYKLVKYCFIFRILNNFEQLKEKAIEKCPRSIPPCIIGLEFAKWKT